MAYFRFLDPNYPMVCEGVLDAAFADLDATARDAAKREFREKHVSSSAKEQQGAAAKAFGKALKVLVKTPEYQRKTATGVLEEVYSELDVDARARKIAEFFEGLEDPSTAVNAAMRVAHRVKKAFWDKAIHAMNKKYVDAKEDYAKDGAKVVSDKERALVADALRNTTAYFEARGYEVVHLAQSPGEAAPSSVRVQFSFSSSTAAS